MGRARNARRALLATSLCWAAASAACRSRSGPRAPEPADEDGATLILYRDLAELRIPRSVTFDGAGVAVLEGIPAGLRLSVKSADGRSLVSDRVLQDPQRVARRGQRIAVISETGRTEGRFEEWTRGGVVLETEAGSMTIVGSELLIELIDAGADAALRLTGARANESREVVISTWLERLSWNVAYTAVLEGANARTAYLQGWLSIDAPAVLEVIRADRLIIVDGSARSRSRPSKAMAGYARAEQIVPEAAFGGARRPPIVTLPLGATLDPGGSVRVPIMRGPRALPVVVTRVFDPIGDSFGHQGAIPISRSGYGTRRDRQVLPVSLSVRLELAGEILAALPAGPVSLFSRADGKIRALGVTHAFGQRTRIPRDMLSDPETAGEASADADRVERPGEIRIGVAPGLSGRRWQEDFVYERDRRRVVEEIRVELVNDSDQGAAVNVVEHLYRGLNWSLAYHNNVGVASKRGPQEVSFAVDVAPESRVLLMYRVVYTW